MRFGINTTRVAFAMPFPWGPGPKSGSVSTVSARSRVVSCAMGPRGALFHRRFECPAFDSDR
eukprot:2393053-Pyramimonas_sp.AAC.1